MGSLQAMKASYAVPVFLALCLIETEQYDAMLPLLACVAWLQMHSFEHGRCTHVPVAEINSPLPWLEPPTSQEVADVAKGIITTHNPTAPGSMAGVSQRGAGWGAVHSFTRVGPAPICCSCSFMDNIPSRQRQRADFLIVLLGTAEAKGVQKQLGIKSHSFLTRLSSNLQLYASIADAPRSGRERKYTDEMLGQAKDQLMEGESYVWSKKDFVHGLMEDGTLPADSSVDGFWEAFVPYMQQQGLTVVYGIQRLTFAMASRHAISRLSWCRQQQSVITTRTVREYWFTDEVTLEHGPHPGGECCPASRQ